MESEGVIGVTANMVAAAPQLSDEELVERYRRGCVEALDDLIRRHERRIYRMAYRMVGSHEDALDLVQEVALKLMRALPRFKGDSRFSTWLYRLTANTCIDFYRKRGRHQAMSLDEMPAVPLFEPEAVSDPEVHVEDSQRELVVNAALQLLPEKQRQLIELRDRSGFSNLEVAEMLGLDVGTLKARLHRARGALRRVLTSGIYVDAGPGLGKIKVTPEGLY